MRAALCLYGLVSSKNRPTNAKACYDSIKHHIIDVNGCDVFMHSWSVRHTDELVALYKPKRATIEHQMKFEGWDKGSYQQKKWRGHLIKRREVI